VVCAVGVAVASTHLDASMTYWTWQACVSGLYRPATNDISIVGGPQPLISRAVTKLLRIIVGAAWSVEKKYHTGRRSKSHLEACHHAMGYLTISQEASSAKPITQLGADDIQSKGTVLKRTVLTHGPVAPRKSRTDHSGRAPSTALAFDHPDQTSARHGDNMKQR
jgi:hypothetical protein